MRKLKTIYRVPASAAILAALFFSASSLRADSRTSQVQVSASVVARTILTVDNAPSQVEVTPADIARGYVELPNALSFRVRSNAPSGYVLEFGSGSGPFAATSVRWASTEVVVASSEAWIAQPYQRGSSAVVATVRLALSPQAAPGVYAWPLQVSARSL